MAFIFDVMGVVDFVKLELFFTFESLYFWAGGTKVDIVYNQTFVFLSTNFESRGVLIEYLRH